MCTQRTSTLTFDSGASPRDVDGLPAHRYWDGEQISITNGGIADVHIVVATVDPNLGHRDARIYEIFEGTKEIQKLVIGREIARSFGGVSA